MGLTRVAAKLRSYTSNDTVNLTFLVDTGAIDSMAPASMLRQLGIQPDGKRVYELASGELLEYEYGPAQVSFMDEVANIDIVFGPDNTEPILGVIALEAAGFVVDPRHQRLRKLRARPLKKWVLPKFPLAA